MECSLYPFYFSLTATLCLLSTTLVILSQQMEASRPVKSRSDWRSGWTNTIHQRCYYTVSHKKLYMLCELFTHFRWHGNFRQSYVKGLFWNNLSYFYWNWFI